MCGFVCDINTDAFENCMVLSMLVEGKVEVEDFILNVCVTYQQKENLHFFFLSVLALLCVNAYMECPHVWN